MIRTLTKALRNVFRILGSPVYTRKTGIRLFYWKPKRITLKSNPAIYRWGYWNFSWDKRVG